VSDTSDIGMLAARIRELEAQLIRVMPGQLKQQADTNCTHCDTDCTHCPGDQFLNVLLPGELDRVSGRALVTQLRAGSGK
jgi:hypothetical protein